MPLGRRRAKQTPAFVGYAILSMRTLCFLFALTSLTTISCSSQKGGVTEPGKQTVVNQPYSVTAEPAVFETSFFAGAQVQQDSVTIRLTSDFLGNLPVPTGQIIATDPVAISNTAFGTQFPRGRFPVELAVAHFTDDERVAFARIVFSAKPVKKWELALIPGQKPLSIHYSTYYGYGVDAGTALFMDAAHVAGLNKHLAKPGAYKQLFIEGFALAPHSKIRRLGFLYAAQNDTLATFATGWGDGFYATYVGFDDHNQPCRLLTDFQVITWR